MQVNLHDAKTHLSRYVDQALAGEEMVIARAGKPLMRLGRWSRIPRRVASVVWPAAPGWRPGLKRDFEAEINAMFEPDEVSPRRCHDGPAAGHPAADRTGARMGPISP